MMLADEKWIAGTNPFGKMNLGYDPNIRCYIDNGVYVVKVVGIENVQGTTNKIYITHTMMN